MEEVSVCNDGMSVSRSGRSLKSKTLEWPPRCPTGVCDMRKGCLCTHTTTVASAYFDCAAEIYGADAPGMPQSRPKVAELPTQQQQPVERPSSTKETPPRIKRSRGRPPGAKGLAKRQRQFELELAMQRDSLISSLDVDQPLASPDVLMLLFSDARDENDMQYNILAPRQLATDLLCDEDPAVAMGDCVKKRVCWQGLPMAPPEWRTGKRCAVPMSWRPCCHSVVADGLLCMRDKRAEESCIQTIGTSGVDALWM